MKYFSFEHSNIAYFTFYNFAPLFYKLNSVHLFAKTHVDYAFYKIEVHPNIVNSDESMCILEQQVWTWWNSRRTIIILFAKYLNPESLNSSCEFISIFFCLLLYSRNLGLMWLVKVTMVFTGAQHKAEILITYSRRLSGFLYWICCKVLLFLTQIECL